MYRFRRLTAWIVVGLAAGALLATTAQGQSSASYALEEHVLNSGGRPAGGTTASSPGYRISLESIGEPLAGTGLTSASYSVSSGFTTAYWPPGEVAELRFVSSETLVWQPDRSAGVYNLYRGGIETLPGEEYGACHEAAIAEATTDDPDVPSPPGEGFFYLVTAENRLAEEGTKGWSSSGSERPNPSPCP
jgi:hypothetical protein